MKGYFNSGWRWYSRETACPRPRVMWLARRTGNSRGRGHGTLLGKVFVFTATFALLFALAGCQSAVEPESLPTYPYMESSETLQKMGERARLVRGLSAEGLITLTKPDGNSVRLDAALVMRPPREARIRAWKFGRAIFDLTIAGDDAWLFTPEDSKRNEQFKSAGLNAGKLAKTWSLLSGGFFEDGDFVVELRESHLTARRQLAGEPMVVCEIDRPTLTVRKYMMLDDKGKQRFSLTLHRYKQFGDVVWPTHLVAVSDGGTIEVELRNVEINPELAENAFTPPRRAEKLP